MAWIEEHPTSGHFKLCFRWGGRKLKKTLKTTTRGQAEAARAILTDTIALVERGVLEIPPGADVAAFLVSGGKLDKSPGATSTPEVTTLGRLRDRYVEALSKGAVEDSSVATVKTHLSHFVATLGKNYRVRGLALGDLQRHVDRRAGKKVCGRALSLTSALFSTAAGKKKASL
jgi:hypothetical protein